MKTIFEEYGGAIITVIAIILFIAIIAFLLSGNNSLVSEQFQSLLNTFFSKANSYSTSTLQ